MNAPLPVTVLTGFLGAGKTTLLNRILAGRHGQRLAVIVNEFGALGIDGGLVVGARDEVVELSNGCLCCTFRGDLVDTLTRLLRGRRALDGVLLETTGIASPVPVAQTFFVSPALREQVALDAIVTLVDARHVELHLADEPAVREQIAFADVLLLNKIDLVDAARVEELRALLAELNPLADLRVCTQADVPLDAVLGVGGFDLQRARARAPDFLGERPPVAHEAGVASVSLEEERPLDAETTTMWLRFLATRRGQDLYRMKGVLSLAGNDRRLVFQGVHTLFESRADRPWGADERRASRLVFIGRELDADELRRGLDACRA